MGIVHSPKPRCVSIVAQTSRPPGFLSPDSASCELPLLTPCSKAVMSQALKATFNGFQKEQRRLGIPKSK